MIWIIVAFIVSNLISWCIGDTHGYWEAFERFQKEDKRRDY